MGTTEHEEPRFFFILNKGAKSGGEITHAVLNGSIVSKPAGWDAFHGLALAREKLSSEEIQQQMKELGVEMEIVPLIFQQDYPECFSRVILLLILDFPFNSVYNPPFRIVLFS